MATAHAAFIVRTRHDAGSEIEEKRLLGTARLLHSQAIGRVDSSKGGWVETLDENRRRLFVHSRSKADEPKQPDPSLF